MANNINLGATLEALETKQTVKDRDASLQDLRFCFDHNSENNPGGLLSDTVCQRTLSTLLNIIASDTTAYKNSKTATTQRSAANKLTASTSTFRHVVGICVRALKTKTVRFVISHLVSHLDIESGTSSSPCGPDLAKSLSTLLSYGPHVEHLSHEMWQELITLCNNHIQGPDDDEPLSNRSRSRSQQPSLSSRAQVKPNGNKRSQPITSSPLSEYMVESLRYLTAARNMDLSESASSLANAVIRYSNTVTASSKVYEDAFGTLNNIIAWASIEDIRLVKFFTVDLLSVIRKHWTTKVTSLKDELLILTIYLQPFVSSLISSEKPRNLLSELRAIQEVVWNDYSTAQEREQLQLEQIMFSSKNHTHDDGFIGNVCFQLRDSDPRAERTWTVVSQIAQWTVLIASLRQADADPEDEEDHDSMRSRKRLRMTDQIDELLDQSKHGSTTEIIAVMQVLTFMVQLQTFPSARRPVVLKTLAAHCADEQSKIATWAFTAAASIAVTCSTTESELLQTIWKLALRAISNATTCRSACHFMVVTMQTSLIPATAISELIQLLATSLDLNGPVLLSDASLDLLQHSLRTARTTYTSQATQLAQRVTTWLTRKWSPSKSERRTEQGTTDLFGMTDVFGFIACAMNQDISEHARFTAYQWSRVGSAILDLKTNEDIVGYLLLDDTHEYSPEGKMELQPAKQKSVQQSIDPSCQVTMLGHLLDELGSMFNIFKDHFQDTPRDLTVELCDSYCKTCYLALLVAYNISFTDLRNLERIRQTAVKLLDAIAACLSHVDCKQDRVDVMLALSTNVMFRRGSKHRIELRETNQEAILVAKAISSTLKARKQDRVLNGQTSTYESIESADIFGTQDSRTASQLPGMRPMKTDVAGYGSIAAQRPLIELHASVIEALNGLTFETCDATSMSLLVTDALRDASQVSASIILQGLSRDLLPALTLSLDDVESALDFCSQYFRAYPYNRSEQILSSIVDFMTATVGACSDQGNDSLWKLGLDMYEWLISVTVTSKVVSSYIQQRVSALLLALCQQAPDYASQSTDSSARTSLFRLLKSSPVSVQFFLAPKLSALLKLYALSTHDDIFKDIQQSLPVETTWVEGIAMRLYTLAELGSAWHSLLRQCVYYIFETAGQISFAAVYAKRCIARLKLSLSLRTPTQLFALFGPQLLHTWLESHNIRKLPCEIFGYDNQKAFLMQNKDEISAQLFLHKRYEDLEYIASEISSDVSSMLCDGFDRVFAYCMSWDITYVTPDDTAQSAEHRLRSAVGGKDKLKALTRDNYGSIIGRMLLAMNQEDHDEKWLEKKEQYKPALVALTAMKKYSMSTAPLALSQQPHFKSKYLSNQLERLGRRLGYASGTDVWNSSAYVLATQMLFDSMDDALGALHSCAVLQKQRLLIALAIPVPLEGYPLELTLRLLAPYLSQPETADDALGMFHYLLQEGAAHLNNKSSLLWSIAMHVALKLKQSESDVQHTGTQTSQQRDTLVKMRKFRSWLLTYLSASKTTLLGKQLEDATVLIESLTNISLPGNNMLGSPESTLLLLMIKNRGSYKPLLEGRELDQSLLILTRDFVSTTDEDCLSDTGSLRRFARGLWQASQLNGVDESFVLWAASVAGRAFASNGDSTVFAARLNTPQRGDADEETDTLTISHRMVADRIVDLARSNAPSDISLALSTLRACLRRLQPIDSAVFQKLFPHDILDAVDHVESQYIPQSFSRQDSELTMQDLKEALASSIDADLAAWMRGVAIALCATSGRHSFIRGLTLLLTNDNGSVQLLLASVVHLVLKEHSTTSHPLKEVLSESMKELFSIKESSQQPRQEIMIKILLYVLQRPYPAEDTLVDRMKWIECDWLVAAECAERCQMSEAALMLIELSRSSTNARRASSRRSLTQTDAVPSKLLLDIFHRIDEPDSYYGVEQQATLQSFLDRAEYEGNALQALTSASAKLGSRMIMQRQADEGETMNMTRSLAAMNLESVVLALSSANGASNTSSDVLFDTARTLRQWDISVPEQANTPSSLLYRAYNTLSRGSSIAACRPDIQNILLAQVKLFSSAHASSKLISAISSTAELLQVLAQPSTLAVSDLHKRSTDKNMWMDTADFDCVHTLLSGRVTTAGVLANNKGLLEGLHLSCDRVRESETGAMIMLSEIARSQGYKTLAESISWSLQEFANSPSQAASYLTTLAKQEIASVLWDLGDANGSITMLQDLVTPSQKAKNTTQAVILSQIGLQLADARLEKPSIVLDKYLQPAIEQLETHKGHDAGQVFHAFATFCDTQLQNSDTHTDFQRVSKLRQDKRDEVDQLKTLVASFKKGDAARKVQTRNLERAKQWLAIDDEEYQRFKRNREVFAEQSLNNYMLTLSATDKHDICVLRLFALWLEYADNEQLQATVSQGLSKVPTWKFVVLMNQLVSRLKGDKSELDKTLHSLLMTVCHDHPYHTVHHLYTARKFPGKDESSVARREIAEELCRDLSKMKEKGDIITRMLKADSLYRQLAEESNDGKPSGKYPIKESQAASRILRHVPKESVPPVTMEIPLQPDGNYDKVPIVANVAQTYNVMTGISTPKVLTVHGSDGKSYKQLFKGGNDDLRQDAIMEQVFGEVSKMLRHHKASRRRDLHIRTYKVIPLSTRSGIIEFVPNSLPINDFLQPAHTQYFPNSLRGSAARQRISAVAEQSREVRVKEFRKVCEQLPPVMRYFFFERFKEADQWFKSRIAYTRTTAAISMLGHILGLGDRHCHNILMDEHSGEVVHIDLGVAFEAGRVLPIPELVPFRLTRDIVDGMGITGVEGTFKRCAEFTLDALRKDKDGIMTLLNVLRYDPLYQWTLSPLKAKQMQQQQTGQTTEAGAQPPLRHSKTNDSEAGEAERALSIVEKKLGNALSTAASVSELIQQATDERNLATLFNGWAAYY